MTGAYYHIAWLLLLLPWATAVSPAFSICEEDPATLLELGLQINASSWELATTPRDDGPDMAIVMQITSEIEPYARYFFAVTARWAQARGIPLLLYDAVPYQGGGSGSGSDDAIEVLPRPVPLPYDLRFGKVALLTHAMSELMRRGSSVKWLLWLDADVLLLEGPPPNTAATDSIDDDDDHNFARRVITRALESSSSSSPSSSLSFIIADQRDSQFGDVNAGTMVVKVCAWSKQFLEAWWGHPAARRAGEYEQLVFSHLWRADALGVRSGGRAALVPMAAMNSHPGLWWRQQKKGKGKKEVGSASGAVVDEAASAGGRVVLQLMQLWQVLACTHNMANK